MHRLSDAILAGPGDPAISGFSRVQRTARTGDLGVVHGGFTHSTDDPEAIYLRLY